MVIEDVSKHLPADGSVWITNNTKYHNFFNGGEQARIHLVACVLREPVQKIMVEFTQGIFNASKNIYLNNKGSILRTIVYTIGHFAIAITVLMLIADVSFMVVNFYGRYSRAFLANAVWYFLLDKFWASKVIGQK